MVKVPHEERSKEEREEGSLYEREGIPVPQVSGTEHKERGQRHHERKEVKESLEEELE